MGKVISLAAYKRKKAAKKEAVQKGYVSGIPQEYLEQVYALAAKGIKTC